MASSRLGGAHNPDGSFVPLIVGRVFDAPLLVLAAFLPPPALPLAMVIQVPGTLDTMQRLIILTQMHDLSGRAL
ncbi:hypothetical protein B0H19DRAFT_1270303 [Mycena capillaripes]|nr:hypothetical protein B0H19DRAFT_1270303 [Mycena capillaripes]